MRPSSAAPNGLHSSVPPVSLLIAFSVLGPMTLHMILPSLSVLQVEFSTDYATTQLLISVFVLGFGGGQVFIGPLADLFGKRWVLCAGLAIYTLTSLLCAFAPNIHVLILLRAMQGISACTGTVLARSIISDHYESSASTRILGYLAMGMSIGPIVAPAAGGFLFELAGWRMPFWSLVALGLATTLLALTLLPPDKRQAVGDGALKRLAGDIGLLLRERQFVGSWLSVCFNAGAVFTFIACVPLVADMTLDLTPTTFGLWFSLGALGYVVGNFVSGRIAGRIDGLLTLTCGAAGVAVFCLLMLIVLAAGTQSPLLIFGLFSLIMASTGLVMPHAFAGAMAAVPAAASSASGFIGFAQYAIGAIFATVAGWLAESRQEPEQIGFVMLFAALCGLGTALVMIRMRRP